VNRQNEPLGKRPRLTQKRSEARITKTDKTNKTLIKIIKVILAKRIKKKKTTAFCTYGMDNKEDFKVE